MQTIPIDIISNSHTIPMTPEQIRVVEAVSPSVALKRVSEGLVVTVHDIHGEKSETVYDGIKGDPGDPGQSPTAKVTETENGAVISVTDAEGTTTAEISNGRDGVSPSISVTDITGGHRITITDATGAHSFDVMDGDVADAPVQDVRVNGVSVLSDGVADVPVARSSAPGVVRVNSNYGFEMDGTAIRFKNASDVQLKAGTNQYRTISPSTQHQAVFYGLAKAAGDSTQSASENAVGTYTNEAKAAIQQMLDVPSTNDIPEVPVQDVQVAGLSVLNDGVANVPVAGNEAPGVIKYASGYGLVLGADEILKISAAGAANVKSGSSSYAPIVTARQHDAAFYGLAKAAGDTTQSASRNTVGQYTESAKSAISEMLNGSVSVSGTAPTINALPGIRYICGEVTTIDITTPASGIIDVVFTSGSTPAVLTVTPPSGMTMKWANGFDPDNLEADTTYEINIADGCLGVAGTWS